MLSKELIQAKQLIEEGNIKEASQIVLELEKRDDYSSQDLLYSKLLKAMIFDRSSEYSKAVKYSNQVLEESQKQSDSFSYLDGLLIQAHSLVMIGDLTRANTILKQAKKVLENLKRVSKTDLRERESFMVRIDTLSIALTGGPRLGLNGNQKALELAKDSDDKGLIVPCLLNLAEDYQALGDYDKAIYYAKRAIEVSYPPYILILLGLLIEIFLIKGDVLNAKFYFQQMSEVREKDQNKYKNLIYQYYEALILKTSL
ncbi:MAG: tetratricopeptide repeat protein, partial [Candidatus Heimdallarchaeota archaeon]